MPVSLGRMTLTSRTYGQTFTRAGSRPSPPHPLFQTKLDERYPQRIASDASLPGLRLSPRCESSTTIRVSGPKRPRCTSLQVLSTTIRVLPSSAPSQKGLRATATFIQGDIISPKQTKFVRNASPLKLTVRCKGNHGQWNSRTATDEGSGERQITFLPSSGPISRLRSNPNTILCWSLCNPS